MRVRDIRDTIIELEDNAQAVGYGYHPELSLSAMATLNKLHVPVPDALSRNTLSDMAKTLQRKLHEIELQRDAFIRKDLKPAEKY